jgi:bla regulator protein BlaR1
MIALLADHLWQSTLVAAVAALLAIVLRRNRPQVRYAIWLAASLKFLVPFAALVVVVNLPGWRPPAASMPPEVTLVVDAISQPFSTIVTAPASRTRTALTREQNTSIVLLGVWFCGFAAVVTTWTARWRRVEAAVRDASPVTEGRELDTLRRLESISRLTKPILLTASNTPLEPGVFGIWRPVLLWPRSISERLDDRQVEAILAHEVAHVRRRDNLAAALHMIVQALFWFYPVVWWLGARLVDERERVCDVEVVRLGSDPQVYAESILQTCQFYLESPLVCVAGVTGSNLKRRIEEIMKNDAGTNLNTWKKLLLVGTAAGALTVPIAVGLLNGSRMHAQSIADETIGPAFPAVSVKPSTGGFAPTVVADGRYVAKGMSLSLLIMNHYRVPGGRIIGAPSWGNSQGFDIEASVEGGATREQIASMVRRLLVDVFKLQVHHETQQLPVYALRLVTRDGTLGPKLRPSTPECIAAADAMHSGAGPQPAFSGPPAPNQVPCGAVSTRPGTFTARAATMAEIVRGFAAVLGRDVLDQTGLAGHFDADVVFTTEAQRPRAPGERPGGYGQASPFIGPAFFTAVEEQLGLKLDSQTGPVDVLVVDHVEKPTP